MIDKIKSILKKEEIEAPRELPDLLSEQLNIQSAQSLNEEVEKKIETHIETKPQTQIEEKPPIKPEPQKENLVKVKVTPESANFIDEDIEDLSPELTEPQDKYTPPKKIQINVPTAEIKYEPKPPQEIIQKPLPKYEIPKEVPVQEAKKEVNSNLQITINGDNFFTKIENIVAGDSTKLKELLEGDLFENMRIYHQKLDEGEKLFLHKSEIENAIKEKVLHLKVLEDEWLIEKRKLEAQEKLFLNKEEELFGGIEELKGLFNKLEIAKKLKKDISVNQSFILKNGTRIISVAGLKKALLNMGEEIYNFHVSKEKNDFASWLENVFNSHEIAKEIRQSKNKDEMINILKDF